MKIKIYLIASFVLKASSLYTQSSFQKSIINEDFITHGQIIENVNEHLYFTCGMIKVFDDYTSPIHVFELNEQGILEASRVFYEDSTYHVFLWDQDLNEEHQAITIVRRTFEHLDPSTPVYSGIYYFNHLSQAYWARRLKLSDGGFSSICLVTSEPSILVSNEYYDSIGEFEDKFALAKLDLDGNTIWNKLYELENQADISVLSARELFEKSTSEFLCFGTASNILGESEFIWMLNIDENGNPNGGKSFKIISGNTTLSGLVKEIQFDAEGNVFLAIVYFDDSISKAGVIKLNSDYEFQWGKRVVVENANLSKVKMSTSSTGETTFAYISSGNFPTTLLSLGKDGELIDYKGYSLFSPEILLAEDGSVLFYSTRSSVDGQAPINQRIIAKTNPDKTFDNCNTYPVCVYQEDIELEIGDLEWNSYPINPLSYLSVTVTDYSMELEETCYTPPAPTPNFHHSDTICLNACPAPDSLENFYAHAQEWTITAPDGSDTLMLDKTPEYCFTQAGTYLIEQTIWFLGCDYSYEQTVEVVPAMDINLGDDGINCNALPYELTLESSRPIMSYEWSDGSTNPTLMLTESGTYWVSSRGPYCEAVERDTIAIEFIEDYVDLPLFSLPSDTSICIQHYPYTISPQSSSALSYTLNGATNAAPSHAITQAGSYIFATTVEGCTFQDTINITTNDCQASIYLPNAFSPNFDGINDELFPQGIDFEMISLEVFDRWGGLVAQSTGSRASWDGVGASVGVYVIQLTYRNLLSNEVEVLVKDVVVIR